MACAKPYIMHIYEETVLGIPTSFCTLPFQICLIFEQCAAHEEIQKLYFYLRFSHISLNIAG
jgi:hypothetical protein